MSDPAQYTVYQALDAGTDPVTLHAMATQRPDLRQFVAANPNTTPEVLDWLGQLGEPAVDAALQRRSAGIGGQPAPPTGAPVSQPGMGTGYDAQSNPYAASPATHRAPAPTGFAPPAGPPQQAAPGAPTSPYAQSAPYTQQAPYAQPGPYAPAGGQPLAGPHSGSPYAMAPEDGGGRRAGMIVAIIVIAALVLIGIVGVAVWRTMSGSGSGDGPVPGPAETPSRSSSLLEGNDYGDNAELDEMWDSCEAGDGQACDDLYMSSQFDSRYEEFGDTCGGRHAAGTVWCVNEM